MKNGICYLAAPFSHPDSETRQWRHEAVCRAAAELIRAGRTVFSPISHSYVISRYGLPLDWEFWRRHDLKYLGLCDEVIVLTLPGWCESIGIQAEIAAARAMGKRVTFMEPVTRSNDISVSGQADTAKQ
jgi:hypothetical protein